MYVPAPPSLSLCRSLSFLSVSFIPRLSPVSSSFFSFFPSRHPPRAPSPTIGLEAWSGNEMLFFRKWRWNEDESPVAERTPSYHLIWYRLLTSALLVETLSRRSRASSLPPSLPLYPFRPVPPARSARDSPTVYPANRCFLPRGTPTNFKSIFTRRSELRRNVTCPLVGSTLSMILEGCSRTTSRGIRVSVLSISPIRRMFHEVCSRILI